MSKIALEGNASGTGTFTIASPNSNSNFTLNLPTSSGTVVVTGGAQTIEFAAGSAAAPSITFTGDTNTGIFSPGADTIAFSEGGAESMRITSAGSVGIGLTSPNATLHVQGSATADGSLAFNQQLTATTAFNASPQSGSLVSLRYNTGGDFAGLGGWSVIKENATDGNFAGAMLFHTRANGGAITERARITSGGNVLIGQTSASSSSFLLNCVGGGILTTRVNIGDLGGFSDGSTLYLGSDSTNSSSWNQSNANYRFGSNRGGCVVAINPGGYTYEGGSGTGTRTFAVNSNGNVQNTNNSYGSLSDAKLKENIVDASPKLDDLMKVKIRNFNLIADESKTKQIGVIAQELEEVFPRMIEEHIDYTYEDYVNEYGNNDKKAIPTGTVTKEVKYSVFVPMLIKAVQELKAELDATKAEVAALKGQ